MDRQKNIDYGEVRPDKALFDFVKCFWNFSNRTGSDLEFTILPDGCFDLITECHDNSLESVSLTGLWTKQVDISIPNGTSLFGVRFKLLSAEYIVQQRINGQLDVERILKNNFWGIDEFPLEDFPKLIIRFQEKLLSIVGSGKGIDNRKRMLFNLLYSCNGSMAINKLADKVSWSSRQINRYFNDTFGLPLKSYCNILRCFASYHQIKEGDLHPKENFYDQSHFIKEIKRHTGVNPKELHRNKNDRFLQLSVIGKK